MSSQASPRLHYEQRIPSISRPMARLSAELGSSRQDLGAGCTLIEGDNLLALSALEREIGAQVTLAYLDPPFLTGRQHFNTKRSRGHAKNSQGTQAFDDRWASLGDYLSALESRLRLVRDLLAPHGSLILHVDPKTSHYLKVLCDEIFGIDSFASEVIWRYRRWPSKTNNFQRVHDVMLRYVKDPQVAPRFNQLFEALAPSTLKTWGDRKQKAVMDKSGKRLRSSKTPEKSRGTPLGDVWEIGIVAPVAKERTGYPTQKPEALLRRWLETCSDPGDLVLDPYMGSGTTLSVAHQLGRRSIGIDEGSQSLEIAQERLAALDVPFSRRRVSPPLARGKRAKSLSEEDASLASAI